MSQFDLHSLRGRGGFVCRIQTDLGIETAQLLCAPVLSAREIGTAIPRLHVPVGPVMGESGGFADGVVVMSMMVAIPGHALGPIIGTAEGRRDEIMRAVDMLVSGF